MKYPFMTFPDDTVITHSDIYLENNKEKIKVYIEQPTDSGFFNATCILPEYSWQNINGFTKNQIKDFQELIEKGSYLIYKFARQGGFGNAGRSVFARTLEFDKSNSQKLI